MWYWHKDRQRDQWNRARTSEINSCISDYMKFHKAVRPTQWRKDSLLNKTNDGSLWKVSLHFINLLKDASKLGAEVE